MSKFPIDTYEAANTGPYTVNVKYSDLDYGADDANDTITLATIPTDAVVGDITVKTVTGFDDSTDALTGMTVIVGDDDNDDGFIESMEVSEDGSTVSSKWNTGDYVDTEFKKAYDNATTKTLSAVFTPTPSTGAASALNAGEIEITFDIRDLS